MISHYVKTALLASTILCCAAVSESSAQVDTTLQSKNNAVASAYLKDGTRVLFSETADGALAVAAKGKLQKGAQQAASINGVAVSRLQGLNAVQQYKLLTGSSAAPEALVAAQKRSDAKARSADAGQPDGQVSSFDGLTAPPATAAASGGDVKPQLSCYSGNWYGCWQYLTGNYQWPYPYKYGYKIYSYSYMYKGYSMLHSVWYYSGGWKRCNYDWIYPGEYSYIGCTSSSYYPFTATTEYSDKYYDYYAWNVWGY
jgi:hypothetical protein